MELTFVLVCVASGGLPRAVHVTKFSVFWGGQLCACDLAVVFIIFVERAFDCTVKIIWT